MLRRASARSRAKAPATARERLGVEAARRGRAGPPAAQAPRGRPSQPPKKPLKPEEAVEEPTDAETAPPTRPASRRPAAASSRKLGKLFGKKQIDAATVDELEEVLFTADIGPRAADRIFQSVKTGLSKADLEDADKIWSQIRKTSRDDPRASTRSRST